MAIIVTYDITSKHVEFKKEMIKRGYAPTFVDHQNKTVYLPNTTLYHASRTPAQARDEVMNVAKIVVTELERCISTESSNWAAIYGEPFKR
ncbi:hypothetical protein BWI96_10600 [Siphonobacter sp. SORGH_AS_0500]|nr:hypothetical protein BWI96_10600 [Siphonobacter sp. SORGH_AS_0500]